MKMSSLVRCVQRQGRMRGQGSGGGACVPSPSCMREQPRNWQLNTACKPHTQVATEAWRASATHTTNRPGGLPTPAVRQQDASHLGGHSARASTQAHRLTCVQGTRVLSLVLLGVLHKAERASSCCVSLSWGTVRGMRDACVPMGAGTRGKLNGQADSGILPSVWMNKTSCCICVCQTAADRRLEAGEFECSPLVVETSRPLSSFSRAARALKGGGGRPVPTSAGLPSYVVGSEEALEPVACTRASSPSIEWCRLPRVSAVLWWGKKHHHHETARHSPASKHTSPRHAGGRPIMQAAVERVNRAMHAAC